MRARRLLGGVIVAGVLAFLLGLVWPAAAQTDTDFWQPVIVRVPLTASIVNEHALGYTLGPEVGAGLEIERGYIASFTNATFGFRHKVETGDGHEIGLTQHVCGHVGPWLGCGGVAYAHTATSRWSKGAARPIIGGGWQRDDGATYARVLVDYEMGSWDSANGLHGLDVDVRYGRRDLWFTASAGIYRFHASGRPTLPDSGWRATAGIGLDPVAWRLAR